MIRALPVLLIALCASAQTFDFGAVASLAIGTNEVQTVAINGETVWRKLPYDEEVAWIESTGTQYINVGTIRSGWFSVDLSATVTSGTQRYDMFFGTQTISGGGLNDRLACYNEGQKYNNFILYRGSDWSYTRQNYPTLTVSKTRFSISVDRDLWLFHNPSFSEYNGRARLRSFKLWDDNDNLTRDFQPVKVGAEGALYDRVSGTLFTNAGTGSFGIP